MRRNSFSTQSANVASVSLCSADPHISGRFYIDIAGLTQRPSRGVDLWDRVGVGAGLTLLQAGNDPSLSDRIAARDATVTIAVSNLRTALRQVLRRGGRIGMHMDAWEAAIRRQSRIDAPLHLQRLNRGRVRCPRQKRLSRIQTAALSGSCTPTAARRWLASHLYARTPPPLRLPSNPRLAFLESRLLKATW